MICPLTPSPLGEVKGLPVAVLIAKRRIKKPKARVCRTLKPTLLPIVPSLPPLSERGGRRPGCVAPPRSKEQNAQRRGVSHPQTTHLYYCPPNSPITPSPLGEGWPKAGVCRTAAKQRTERATPGCVPLSNHPYPPIVP